MVRGALVEGLCGEKYITQFAKSMKEGRKDKVKGLQTHWWLKVCHGARDEATGMEGNMRRGRQLNELGGRKVVCVQKKLESDKRGVNEIGDAVRSTTKKVRGSTTIRTP